MQNGLKEKIEITIFVENAEWGLRTICLRRGTITVWKGCILWWRIAYLIEFWIDRLGAVENDRVSFVLSWWDEVTGDKSCSLRDWRICISRRSSSLIILLRKELFFVQRQVSFESDRTRCGRVRRKGIDLINFRKLMIVINLLNWELWEDLIYFQKI